MSSTNLTTLLESPDGESRAQIARLGDAFPLDPSTAVFEASDEPPTGVRPWGLRRAVTPKPRPEVAAAVDRYVYDPVVQRGIDRLTGAPAVGKRSSGTKETTGEPDSARPSTEETTTD
ncbi:putative ATP-grasp-modified RiPP [Nocardiopsis alborubida]|uniref:Putative ATP-grasp-modified RiPP n=1 Tax=Nocardiopsis alborubida TaxID=146802 RepID=A0A7X6MIF7_9ACTN|nr:putative ATP-grasp-modified RiPP [Nocardiopsis alborubida]NKZ01610.1 putative ATP-grasp-modified RiPP [Nocardiopsis alborubida]